MESNVINYVLEKYPKTFKNKNIIVEDNDHAILCQQTKTNHH
jgi:hypothetical protein